MAIDLFDPITLSAMVRRLPDTPPVFEKYVL